jgi:hypothetical protein
MNIYLDSIDYKIRSANYHLIYALDALKGETKHPDILLASGAEFIAMMSALHSCMDVLAQWINIEYNLNIDVSEVSFSKVIFQIKDNKMKQKLLEFKKAATYLDDFCNYNKHRNIVKVKQVSYFISMYQPSVEYDIEEFKRNGRKYKPETLKYQLHHQYGLVLDHLKIITGYRFPLRNPEC